MSLFVTRDNQTLLWNVINKNKKINNAFQGGEEEKQEWFKDIIREFHQSGQEAYNIIQLKQLNKDVIQFMIQDVKNRLYHLQTQHPQQQNQHTYIQQHNQDNKQFQHNIQNNIQNNIQDNIQDNMSDYERREQEYRKLLEKPQPKEINFAEDTSAEYGTMSPIELEQKMKAREGDIVNIKNPLAEENKLLNERITTLNTVMDKMQQTINSIIEDNKNLRVELNNVIVKQEVSNVITNAVHNIQ